MVSAEKTKPAQNVIVKTSRCTTTSQSYPLLTNARRALRTGVPPSETGAPKTTGFHRSDYGLSCLRSVSRYPESPPWPPRPDQRESILYRITFSKSSSASESRISKTHGFEAPVFLVSRILFLRSSPMSRPYTPSASLEGRYTVACM